MQERLKKFGTYTLMTVGSFLLVTVYLAVGISVLSILLAVIGVTVAILKAVTGV